MPHWPGRSSPSEAAKRRLLNTWARLELLGVSADDNPEVGSADGCVSEFPKTAGGQEYRNPASELRDAIDRVNIKLAKEVLKAPGPDCPDLDRVKKVLAEVMLFDTSTELERSLMKTYQALLRRCNVIEGTIQYSILMPRKSFVYAVRSSDPRYWTEYHDIALSLLTSGGAGLEQEEFATFNGSDEVRTDFGRVEYREQEDDCAAGFYSSEHHFWGDPAKGLIEVTLAGRIDPQQGLVPESATGSQTVSLKHLLISRGIGWDGQVGCYVDNEIPLPLPDIPYQGQISVTSGGVGAILMGGASLQQLPTL